MDDATDLTHEDVKHMYPEAWETFLHEMYPSHHDMDNWTFWLRDGQLYAAAYGEPYAYDEAGDTWVQRD